MNWYILAPEFWNHGDFVVVDEHYLGLTRCMVGFVLVFSSRRAAAEFAQDRLPGAKIKIKQAKNKFLFERVIK